MNFIPETLPGRWHCIEYFDMQLDVPTCFVHFGFVNIISGILVSATDYVEIFLYNRTKFRKLSNMSASGYLRNTTIKKLFLGISIKGIVGYSLKVSIK